MKIVCAWCGRETGEKDGGGVDGVSHTICKGCSDKLALRVGAEEAGTGKNDDSGTEVKDSRNGIYSSEDRDRYGVRGY